MKVKQYGKFKQKWKAYFKVVKTKRNCSNSNNKLERGKLHGKHSENAESNHLSTLLNIVNGINKSLAVKTVHRHTQTHTHLRI